MGKRILVPLEFDANSQSDPAAGYVRLYNDLTGGRARLHTRRAGHRPSVLQSHLGRVRAVMSQAQGDSTTVDNIGAAFTAGSISTLTAVTTDPTGGFVQGMRRVAVEAASSSSAVAGIFANKAQWTRGDAAGKGGFYMAFRWAPGIGQASTTRGFCGVTSLTSGLTDAEPSAQDDVFGMGWDTADSNIQIMRRTGTGTVQKYNTSFAKPTTTDGECYQFEIYAHPNGSAMAWRLEALSSGAFDFETYSSDIPAQGTFLAPRIAMSVAGVTGVIGIRFMSFYGESDV
jgi:hypothetical protein